MLRLTIPESTLFDDDKQEFIETKNTTIQLEHSLVSISKWEARWKKPFLKTKRTREESIDYVRCMTISQNVDPNVYYCLRPEHFKQIEDYINDGMTATTFSNIRKESSRGSFITSEQIYYQMFSLGIDVKCEKWHLNRLMTLIRIFNIENSPKKKMSEKEILAHNRMLNEQRKRQHHTKG